jgi:hypothetical protein
LAVEFGGVKTIQRQFSASGSKIERKAEENDAGFLVILLVVNSSER